MAQFGETRGRPRYIADDFPTHDPQLPYSYAFHDACQTFSYREMLALSRRLGCSLRTVYRWKNGEKFPRNIGTMLAVVDWTSRGKAIKLETQAEAHKSPVL
jgi:hypothetical protein